MKRVSNLHERPDISEIQNGFDLKNLLSSDGADFTVNYIDDDFSIENIDESLIDKHVFHIVDRTDWEDTNLDDNCITYSIVKDKLVDYYADGKIKKYILRHGKGLKPEDGIVFAHYISYVENDRNPFDSTYRRSGDPEKFRLGCGRIYEGFEIALKSMKRDELACFLIHPDLAFRKMGAPPRIPGNAHIFLQIHLVKFVNIRRKEELKDGEDNLEDEVIFTDTRSFNEIYKRVKAELQKGNDNFRSGLISKALSSFHRARGSLHMCRLKSDDEEKKWKNLLLKVSLNLCVCYNHNSIKKPNVVCLVVRDLFETIPELTNKNAKVLFQYAKAKFSFNDFKNAEKYFKRALMLKGGDDEEILNQLDLVWFKRRQEEAIEEIDSNLMFQRNKEENKSSEDPDDKKKEEMFEKLFLKKGL